MQDTVEEATNFVADAARLKAIKELLKHSPTGAAAVEFVELRNIKVVFSGNTGSESYWDGHRIVIARHLDLGDAALTLVHEAKHAAVSSRPDPRAVARDEFVRKMLENEVQSRVAEARTARELDSAFEHRVPRRRPICGR